MIITTRRYRYRAWLMLAVSAIFILIFYIRLSQQHLGILRKLSPGGSLSAEFDGLSTFYNSSDIPAQRTPITPADDMLQFWRELLDAMLAAAPQTRETVVIPYPVVDFDMQPNVVFDKSRTRVDKTHLPDDVRDALREAHAAFFASARQLAARLPFTGRDEVDLSAEQRRQDGEALKNEMKTRREPDPAGASAGASAARRGIVMTAGRDYLGIALTSLLMLRRSGSRLPVQLFLDSDADYDQHLCGVVLPGLGVECHVMQRFWETTPHMPELHKYQLKAFAILQSPFREVLFMDADCWPIRSPDYLFDAEPFASKGLVTWPDFWLSTAAPVLYEPEVLPSFEASPSPSPTPSLSILGIPAPAISDRRSSESGILLYDKARQATSLLLAAYYNFYGPDFYYPLLSQGAAGEGDKETFLHGALVAGTPFYDVRTPIGILGRWVNGTYVGAAMLQSDPADDWQREEERARRPLHAAAAARPLFVHHNLIKIDIQRLGQSMERVYAVDSHEGVSRLWHVDDDFLRAAGYDVERALWDEVLQALCSRAAHAIQSQDCEDLRRYYQHVFAP